MKRFIPLLLVFLLGAAAVVWARVDVDMTFRGTLIEPPPCTINNGNRIDVDFGQRVGINKIDGVNYRQAINYQITCEDNKHQWALTLRLIGNTADFDNTLLLTSKANLGVKIYLNDKPFIPGSTVAIDLANPPTLEAVPVKKAGSQLSEGAFETWATLRADYL